MRRRTERGISYHYAQEHAPAADGIALEPFLETGNTDVITRLVRENRGVSFLPEFVVREAPDCGRLAALSVDCPQMELFIRLSEERISRNGFPGMISRNDFHGIGG